MHIDEVVALVVQRFIALEEKARVTLLEPAQRARIALGSARFRDAIKDERIAFLAQLEVANTGTFSVMGRYPEYKPRIGNALPERILGTFVFGSTTYLALLLAPEQFQGPAGIYISLAAPHHNDPACLKRFLSENQQAIQVSVQRPDLNLEAAISQALDALPTPNFFNEAHIILPPSTTTLAELERNRRDAKAMVQESIQDLWARRRQYWQTRGEILPVFDADPTIPPAPSGDEDLELIQLVKQAAALNIDSHVPQRAPTDPPSLLRTSTSTGSTDLSDSTLSSAPESGITTSFQNIPESPSENSLRPSPKKNG